jgi:NitT/TauT family transport system permease protein
MKESPTPILQRLLPIPIAIAAVALWGLLSKLKVFPESAFPTPIEVLTGFGEEIRHGRMLQDLIASLFRVSTGFVLAVILGIPLGLLIGMASKARLAFLPFVNFFRSLSPLAWIPFAILWFGVGDVPSIFLIFMSVFFPVVLSTAAAVANISAVHLRVGRDYGLRGASLLTQVTIPAILPQIITTLRVTAGLAWLVVVAAEMIAGRDGLGFLIWDARNGLRIDLVVVGMVVIGLIGVVLDRVLMQLTRIPSVRWGYER